MTRLKTHPGEVLREEFLLPRIVAQFCEQMGNYYGVDSGHVYEVIEEERDVDRNMALALANYFANTPDFWLNLQKSHDESVRSIAEAPQAEGVNSDQHAQRKPSDAQER